MSDVVKDIGRGFVRSSVIWLVSAGFVVILSCVCIFLPLWLVTSQEMPIWILILSLVLYMGTLFVGAGGIVYTIYNRRKRMLDMAFQPLGLEGKVYQLFFRQYHGEYKGETLSIYFYRGPVLEIELDTSLDTRFSFSQTVDNRLADLVGSEALDIKDVDLESVRITGLDRDWIRKLLAQEGVAENILSLTGQPANFTARTLYLRPGKLVLSSALNPKLFKFDLPAEDVLRWVDDLLMLLAAVESLPRPTATAEKTVLEKTAERMRQSSSSMWKWVGLAVGVSLICLVCVFVVSYLVVTVF